mmetsp:Transcript_342/g.829  ORF Transcript_342/g.829 Transcript_342/m.829 type:complete len:105 (+) Transcript_342:307-621(+)
MNKWKEISTMTIANRRLIRDRFLRQAVFVIIVEEIDLSALAVLPFEAISNVVSKWRCNTVDCLLRSVGTHQCNTDTYCVAFHPIVQMNAFETRRNASTIRQVSR